MKSEPLRFSPTSAGVRIEHLKLNSNHNNSRVNNSNNNSINNKEACHIDNNSCKNKGVFSLPRAHVQLTPPPKKKGESVYEYHQNHSNNNNNKFVDLEQVLVHPNETLINRGRRFRDKGVHENGERKSSNKMRNCCIFTGVVVLLGLLSFVIFVECRSVKTSSKKHYDAEISSESRIQDASTQDPDPESSEEYPTKIVPTTAANNRRSHSSSSSTSSYPFPSNATTKSKSSSRLTRSRVSVVCKSGYLDSGERFSQDQSDVSSPPGSKVSTKKTYSRSKDVDLPTLLPRESDDNEGQQDYSNDSDDKESKWDDDGDDDVSFNSEEIRQRQRVVTLTGYSQVSGGRPETKAAKRSGSSKIKYVPKPSASTPNNSNSSRSSLKKRLELGEDVTEESASSEEVEIVSVPPKLTDNRHNSRQDHLKSRSSNPNRSETVSNVARTPIHDNEDVDIPPYKSTRRTKQGSKKRQRSRPQSSEEDGEGGEEESAEIFTSTTRRPKHRSSKKSSSSKRSGNSKARQESNSTRSEDNDAKAVKGDQSDEIEDESLFPTAPPPSKKASRNNNNNERKQSRKKSTERRQKTPKVLPKETLADSELESAEAEPIPVSTEIVSTSSSSSSSKKSTSSRSRKGGSEQKRATATSVPFPEESSEEYNLEETPLEIGRKERKRSSSLSSTSPLSSSHRSSRMSTRTSSAPKMRTRMFSSVEED